jgi:uncharacterized protein YaiE (UPF0345 family)
MGAPTISVNQQDIDRAMVGTLIQAEFFFGKKEFNKEELGFINHMATLLAHERKWNEFYSNLLHFSVDNDKTSV